MTVTPRSYQGYSDTHETQGTLVNYQTVSVGRENKQWWLKTNNSCYKTILSLGVEQSRYESEAGEPNGSGGITKLGQILVTQVS